MLLRLAPFTLPFLTTLNSLIDHFVAQAEDAATRDLKALLLRLNEALASASLTNQSLGGLRLPRDLDPRTDITLPSRLGTLWNLIKDSASSLIRLPFFFFPLLLHLPAYVAAKLTVRLINPVEQESYAQNKIVFGLILLALIYPALFFALWLLLFLSPVGAILAFGL